MKQLRSELSMNIRSGSNYSDSKAQAEIRDLLASPLSDYDVVAGFNDQHVLSISYRDDCTKYFLVVSTANLKKNKSGLVSDLVSDVIGLMYVTHSYVYDVPDIIDIVWVSSKYRGRGYGEGLHRFAYKQSSNGIRSSTDLGTQSLATLIRLYQKERSIKLIYDEMDVPRDQVTINGTNVLWGKLNLCSPKANEFWFEWRK